MLYGINYKTELDFVYAQAYEWILNLHRQGVTCFSPVWLEDLPYARLCELIQALTKTTGQEFALEFIVVKDTDADYAMEYVTICIAKHISHGTLWATRNICGTTSTVRSALS